MANEDTVYKDQSALMIRLNTKVDLTDATIMKIKYKKPGGTTGEWNASKDTTYEERIDGSDVYVRIYYNIPDDTVIDESGIWTFWSHVTFAGGRAAPGNPFQKHFQIEGS
jgi:hypothetical protein